MLVQLLLDVIVNTVIGTAIVMTVTSILPDKATFLVSRRLQQAGMTFCMWIKSHIKTDKRHKRGTYRRKQSRYCKRYYVHSTKKRPARIATKTAKYIIRPMIQANNSQVHIPGSRRDRPQEAIFDSDSFVITVDNGASRSIGNNKAHFDSIEPLGPNDPAAILGPSGEASPIKGKGTLSWRIEDDDGIVHTIKLKDSLYVPSFTNCLLCTQHWSQVANDHFPKRDGTWQASYGNRYVMYWDQQRYKKTIEWNSKTNTGIFRSAAGAIDYRVYSAAVDADNEVEKHEHLCFQSHSSDTHLISDDESDNDHSESIDDMPNERSTRNNNDKPSKREATADYNETREENLTDYFTEDSIKEPTHVIDDEDEPLAADTPQAELLRWHYRLGHISFARLRILALMGTIPRRLLHVKNPKCAGCLYGAMTKRPWRYKSKENKGKIRSVTSPGDCVSVDQMESSTPGFVAQLKGRLTRKRYEAATVFVDHASRLSYVHLQQGLTSDETVQAKRAFEAYARSHGVTIRHYHADNGRFADNEFLKDIAESGQTISFCGAYAHFQNGIAEKRIRDLQEQTRKQLLHAKARWPSAIEINLWPYALRTANDIRNTIPDKDDGSSPLERFCKTDVRPKLRNYHPFGCPVYALDNRLQGGGRIPKWTPRSRLGINLGYSPRHASSVSLVLNMDTGHVSPQFHVQYDDFFETVRPSAGNARTFSQWQQIAGLKRAAKTPMRASEGALEPEPTIPTSETQPDELGLQHESEPNELDSGEETADAAGTNDLPDRSNESSDDTPSDQRNTTETNEPNVSRYGRVRKPTTRMKESLEQRDIAFQAYYEAMHEDDYLLQDEMQNPVAFLAHANKDTMYFHQAMKAPDRDEFIKAVVKEVNDHIENKHWELVPRESVPRGVDVLPSVWSMKRKRDIKTQRVYKHKARLNVHGGKQEFGENYFETYAPVVTWFSIRLLLVLSILNNWHTRQVDFVLAYPQADIEFDMYMELPTGIETKYGNGKTHVLKLLKNLYGQKQAGRVWNQHLVKGLKSIGFRQSKVDECVFFRGTVIFIVYVDDGIFASPDKQAVDKAISEMQEHFDMDDQGDITDYLGVNVEKLPNGDFKLTQPHLIQQIVDETRISKRIAGRPTPAASTKILQRDENAPAFNNRFNYRRAVGKLNFLEKSTRPDIAYATHQVARFCEDPKASHGEAIEHIAKYLRDTSDQGIILRPSPEKSFDVFADAEVSKSTLEEPRI
jgi:hypothetical protein